MNKKCLNSYFFETFLKDPTASVHSVSSALGVSSFRVTNQKFLKLLEEKFETNEVEAEFSFVRNSFLHYEPELNFGVYSVATLLVRVKNQVFLFVMSPDRSGNDKSFLLHAPLTNATLGFSSTQGTAAVLVEFIFTNSKYHN